MSFFTGFKTVIQDAESTDKQVESFFWIIVKTDPEAADVAKKIAREILAAAGKGVAEHMENRE